MRMRRNMKNYGDPYLLNSKPDEAAVCRRCRSVYAGHRWELESQAGNDLSKARHVAEVLCPACEKIKDRIPGGIISLSGDFFQKHEQEALSLIKREARKAIVINPMERIMGMERQKEGLTIWTTNEKLAQRLGRALYKAFRGSIEYNWSKNIKLLRVKWHRD